MSVPVRLLCGRYPIQKVWQVGNPWKVYQAYPPVPVSEEFDLENGNWYWIFATQDFTLKWQDNSYNITANPGGFPIQWIERISFTPGNILNWKWFEDAQATLERLKLWKLLSIIDVREIRVIPADQFPPGHPGVATSWQSSRSIIFADRELMPGSAFSATILHEALHLWQMDRGFPAGGDKAELSAYTASQVFHLLNGEDINVFASDSPYPAARGLL